MQSFALVFPGQGSQYVGMGKELCTEFRVARDVFTEASDTLGFDLASLCFEGPRESLDQTIFTQTAVLTADIAALRVFEAEIGLRPRIMAGHSLGEYGALVAAGAVDFSRALTLVEARARLQQDAVPLGKGGMAAILDMDPAALEEICAGVRSSMGPEGAVYLAINNGPTQISVAGLCPALDETIVRVKQAGGRGIKIPVSVPFHCELMAGAAERFAEVLGDMEFREFGIPVVPNCDPGSLYTPEKVRHLLVTQIRSLVRWHESVNRLSAAGVGMVVEAGPRKVLSGLIKRIDKNLVITNIEDLESLKKTLKVLNESAG